MLDGAGYFTSTCFQSRIPDSLNPPPLAGRLQVFMLIALPEHNYQRNSITIITCSCHTLQPA